MRAIFINRYGGTEVLEEGDQPRPVPRSRQVLVEVHAASVNPRDWLLREGRYVFRYLMPGFPLILGSDVSGVVVELGPKATLFRPGDAVFGMQTPLGRMGGYAEYIAIDERALAKKPANISHEEAAAVPCAGLTAYGALLRVGRTRAGSRVTIIGASGGVGTYATQIAKALGAVVSGVSSARNASLVQSLGADRVIDYTTERFDALVYSQDLVFDTIGRESLQTCSRVLTRQGRYVTTIPSVSTFTNALTTNLWRTLRMGNAQSAHTILVRADGQALSQIASLMSAEKVRSVIDSVFPLSEVRLAHERSRSWRSQGKLVLQVRT
ncbi:MAG TPA: NAD(P)-dependent alcohol dehydrogenase [Thermoanaerobaculia bacterium]|nr:NAD(P)-dependent alcohol dehydrogenase [Thermoanaerobaculia bacterium]